VSRAAAARDRIRARARYLRDLALLGFELPGFLRRPVSVPDAGRWLSAGLAEREQRFLERLERDIYASPSSPYVRLLRSAGCELGDVRRLVATEGVEGALERLRDAGVYLTFDEFKGRRDVERGGVRWRFREADFDPPRLRPHLLTSTGGTRRPGTRLRTTLPFLRDLALTCALAFDAHRLVGASHGVWLGSLGLPITLQYAKLGATPLAWFGPLERLPRPQEISTRYLGIVSRLAGRPLPLPQFVGLEEPERIAQWIATRGRRDPVCFTTYASSAVRAARAAYEGGLDLSRTCFVVNGEPFTAAKLAVVTRAGARTLVRYALTEAGVVGLGCAASRAPDDVHFFRNSYAMIERRRTVGAGGPIVDALLLTSLLDAAPKVLLNVETGDSAMMERRECNCPLGAAGLTTHLDSIRSFEKLSGEGMTFIQVDLLRVLEDVLPARFGGVGADYQVLEEEDPDGILRLSLLVNPRLGTVDPDAVRAAFLDALARQPGVSAGGVTMWRRAETVRVVRRPPVATGAGKILPFHVAPR
jgi:hypothetical protein